MSKKKKEIIQDVEDNKGISSGAILFVSIIVVSFMIIFSFSILMNCYRGITRIERNMKYINESIDDINENINSINYRLDRIEKKIYEINNNKVYILER